MNDKVAIVGSGLVGRAWAISFARGGHDVVLFDADNKAVANALRTVEGLLTKLELAGMLKGQTAVEVRSRINGAPSLEAALAGAAHVQENAPEELGVKREIFAKLDAAAERNAVLASSSSGILPSRISDELAGKSRCLVAHRLWLRARRWRCRRGRDKICGQTAAAHYAALEALKTTTRVWLAPRQ
jgi:L-gulonate 3-dehydrogenase